MSEKRWNEKASTYSRYGEDENSFEVNVLKDVKKYGISFKDKRVLDVGCGTGIYTLHVAKEALCVDGIDFAKQMLDVLKKDAKSLHVDNVTTVCSTWEEFTCKEFYDIAFSTMSPALTSVQAYEKFDVCAKQKVYLGWGGKRESSLLNPLFELLGKTYRAPKGALELQKWLNENKKEYFSKEYEEVREISKSFEDMFENVCWHLKIGGIEVDEKIVKEYLKSVQKDGIIKNEVKSKMMLLIWEK